MFLGLDLGTSNVKVLVVEPDGSVAAEGSAPVTRSTTPEGGVEQDIDQIWDATCQAIQQALRHTDGQPVQAVGVSSQGGAMQLLDAHERPLGRVISWLDTRGSPFDRQLEEQWGEAYLVAHTGCNLSAMTLGQILRLRRESPELLDAARFISFVGDVIVGRLCGRRAHDPSSLSIAMLHNPVLGCADPDLLGRLQIQDKRLPDLVPVGEPAGRLQGDAARRTGLAEGIPVSPAIHDQYAASLGAGSVNEGDVLLGTGTAWVLLAVTGRLAPPIARRTFVCPHPIDGLFGQLLSMGNGGSALEWVLEITGQSGLDPEALDERLASVLPGADGLLFWPLLGGSTPATGSLSGGRLSGLALGHTANHLLRGVVEGLACELTRHLGWFTGAGLPVKRLVMTGPAAASRVSPQILANVANMPVAGVHQSSVSAFGAATVARGLVEANSTLRELAAKLVPDCRTVSPDSDVETYQRKLQQYLEPFADMGHQR